MGEMLENRKNCEWALLMIAQHIETTYVINLIKSLLIIYITRKNERSCLILILYTYITY